ncbi:MAG: hypothetical protein Q9185_006076 [Variospora sp. 1 TL-2023]
MSPKHRSYQTSSHTTLRPPTAPKKLQKQPSASTLHPSSPTTHPQPPSPSTTSLTPLTKQQQTPSNRASSASLRTLPPTHSAPASVPSSRAPSISPPAPPPKLLRLSELLDPDELIREEQQQQEWGTRTSDVRAPAAAAAASRRPMVQSPSGNQLDAETFARRPDRPLTVGERQTRIREETVRKGDEARRERLRVVTTGGRRKKMKPEEAGWLCCVVM